MRKLILLIVPLIIATGHVQASSGNSKVMAMLKRNPIINAAIAEGKKFSGAKSCEYKVEASEVPEFQKDTTFDYLAEITCLHNETAAIIRVEGRMFSSDGPQTLTLSIVFAG